VRPPVDITAVLNVHAEGILSGPSFISFEKAIEQARDATLNVQGLIVLDRPDEATRLQFEGKEKKYSVTPRSRRRRDSLSVFSTVMICGRIIGWCWRIGSAPLNPTSRWLIRSSMLFSAANRRCGGTSTPVIRHLIRTSYVIIIAGTHCRSRRAQFMRLIHLQPPNAAMALDTKTGTGIA
jgi:hypothetical protein